MKLECHASNILLALIEVAQPVNYEEISKRAAAIGNSVKLPPVRMGVPLRLIDKFCLAQGLPPVWAVLEMKNDEWPEELVKRHGSVESARAICAGFDWSSVKAKIEKNTPLVVPAKSTIKESKTIRVTEAELVQVKNFLKTIRAADGGGIAA